MLDKALAQTIIDKYKAEEVLDMVIDTLTVAQTTLSYEHQDQNNNAFRAGVAIQDVAMANHVLRALRDKQYGQRSVSIL